MPSDTNTGFSNRVRLYPTHGPTTTIVPAAATPSSRRRRRRSSGRIQSANGTTMSTASRIDSALVSAASPHAAPRAAADPHVSRCQKR